MLSESIALYGAALACNSLAVLTAAPAALGRLPAATLAGRTAWWSLLALAMLSAWRCVPPFWYALRVGLYDFRDALLSAAAAATLLLLASALRRQIRS